MHDEVIADVHDRGDLTGIERIAERAQQARRAHTAAENRYHLRDSRGASVSSSAVSTNSLLDGWPGTPSVVLVSLEGGVVRRIAEAGDLDAVRPWASVSKMVVSLAFGVESDWEEQRFDRARRASAVRRSRTCSRTAVVSAWKRTTP